MRWPAPSRHCAPIWRGTFGTVDLDDRLDAGLQPEAEPKRCRRPISCIYSALTTVARRPDTTWSWTENWPYEPEVGNTPTTNTFIWTWISFCFTFFAFGIVLFIYKFWLETSGSTRRWIRCSPNSGR